jgi:outer membrane protein
VSRFIKTTLVALLFALPAVASAQGKIAVVNLQEAILQTDLAEKRLTEVRNQEDYKTDKAEFDRLKTEFEDLAKKFQKDAAVMSQEQQLAARKKLASKQADLEHVTGKLQQAEQAAGQGLLQEMSPRVQQVLRELITAEGIGLLLQQQAVIHADAGYSITAKVTDKLNQMPAE